ncbi:hypothetical protein [Parasphingorhabdus sp.]|uniref:hypothetical protein n=1 Tax=Parasphingorhabdus sp. TaxID=2709688 RepID=UPI003A8CB6AB
MRTKLQSFFILGLPIFLASCGSITGGCSGIEFDAKRNDVFDLIDVSIRNTTDEPKLVTIAAIGSDGEEIKRNTMRVNAKDIAETKVVNMKEGRTVDLIECE